MDLICQSIFTTLHVRAGYTSKDIEKKTGFAHQTVSNHLKHLLEADLVTRGAVLETKTHGYASPNLSEKRQFDRHKRGRPKILYRRKKLVKELFPKYRNQKRYGGQTGTNGCVSIEFSTLKDACRFNNHGQCSKKVFSKTLCYDAKCPLILRASAQKSSKRSVDDIVRSIEEQD